MSVAVGCWLKKEEYSIRYLYIEISVSMFVLPRTSTWYLSVCGTWYGKHTY